jgi:hypothetical protein
MTSTAEMAPVVINDLLCYIQQRSPRLSDDELAEAICSNVTEGKLQSAVQLLETQFSYKKDEEDPQSLPTWLVGVVKELTQVEEPVPQFVASDLDMLAALLDFETKKVNEDRFTVLMQEVQRLANENVATKASIMELAKLDQQKQQQIDSLRQSMDGRRYNMDATRSQNLPATGSTGGDMSRHSANAPVRQESYSAVAARQLQQYPGPSASAAGTLPASSGSAAVGDGWINPNKKRPPRVYGGKSSSADDGCELHGVKRQAHIFVFRCSPSTSEEALSNFCTTKKVRVVSCDRVETNPEKLATFHLVVDFDDRDKVLNDDFFPNHIMCRRWRLEGRKRTLPPHGQF